MSLRPPRSGVHGARALLPAILAALSLLPGVQEGGAQEPPPVGREAALSLTFPPLDFTPPRARRETVGGVPVFFLEDRSLPLVTIFARFRGGYALLPRSRYAATTALPSLVRAGGTRRLPPDSVNRLLEFYAAQTTFGSGGEATVATLNVLRKHLEPALELWLELLREPGFDSTEVEVWRGRQLEQIRRRRDDPGLLAFSEFNRLMFGDHPTGWEMEPSDLDPAHFSREALEEVRRRILCRENLVLGVVGDLRWSEAETLLDRTLASWPACPDSLPPLPLPQLRQEGGVFVIQKPLSQSTIVMAAPGGVRQDGSREYFASRVANAILGASGLGSRLPRRLRTELGLAYSASSLWTAPSETEGVVGAVTRTRADATVAATRAVLEVMEEFRSRPPSREEVDRIVSELVNGFVFGFQDAAQVVTRQITYLGRGLPPDWLARYLRGIQRVTPEEVYRVVRDHLDPGRMTILIVGDTTRFDLSPGSLGPVTVLSGR